MGVLVTDMARVLDFESVWTYLLIVGNLRIAAQGLGRMGRREHI